MITPLDMPKSTWKAVGRATREFLLDAIEKQGVFAFSGTLRDVAVHEASHAVLAAVDGLMVYELEIWELAASDRRRIHKEWIKKLGIALPEFLSADIWQGICRAGGMINLDERQLISGEIAGFIGENLFGTTGERPLYPCGRERIAASALAEHTWGKDVDAVWQDICSETAFILKSNEDIVEEISSILVSGNAINAVTGKKTIGMWKLTKMLSSLRRAKGRHPLGNYAERLAVTRYGPSATPRKRH